MKICLSRLMCLTPNSSPVWFCRLSIRPPDPYNAVSHPRLNVSAAVKICHLLISLSSEIFHACRHMAQWMCQMYVSGCLLVWRKKQFLRSASKAVKASCCLKVLKKLLPDIWLSRPVDSGYPLWPTSAFTNVTSLPEQWSYTTWYYYTSSSEINF